MLIGEVARRSGVSARMLRHYDRLGLVRPTGRTTGGYREYSEADIRRIFHVESLRSLGLSLAEVGRALDDAAFTPAELVTELIAETERRVAQGEELLGRLRQVDAAGPDGWDDVLRVVALLRALESPRERHRLALSAAEELPAPALAEAFLAEEETNVAGALRWALARAGPGALESLVTGLRSTEPDVRRRAVEALAAVADTGVGDVLEGVLADPDEEVRVRAALALGRRGGAAAVPVLAAMVAWGRLDVEAAEILGVLAASTLGPDHVVDVLVEAAGEGPAPARRRLAQALADIPGTAAEDALRLLAQDADRAVALTARAVLSRARG